MTITQPDAVSRILRNGCQDEGFHFPLIYSYRPKFSPHVEHYALFTDKSLNDMVGNPYVLEYDLLAEDGELTDAGKDWLEKHG